MNVPLILAPAMGQQCVITQMEVTRVSVSKVIQEMASNAQVMLVKYFILVCTDKHSPTEEPTD